MTDEPKTDERSRLRKRLLPSLAYVAVLAPGVYVTAYFRSLGWGIGLGSLMLYFGVGFWLYFPALFVVESIREIVRIRRRDPNRGLWLTSAILNSVLLCLFSALIVEPWFSLEELAFRREMRGSTRIVFRPRRYPFGNHNMVFDPESGFYTTD